MPLPSRWLTTLTLQSSGTICLLQTQIFFSPRQEGRHAASILVWFQIRRVEASAELAVQQEQARAEQQPALEELEQARVELLVRRVELDLSLTVLILF